jgi:hypothetical protein
MTIVITLGDISYIAKSQGDNEWEMSLDYCNSGPEIFDYYLTSDVFDLARDYLSPV